VPSKLASCRLCPRLCAHRSEQRQKYPAYHNRPVAGYGADSARLLIVGLAPGLHGANASGIPFTGDASGAFLFAALRRFGFARDSSEAAVAARPQLLDCRITNAVKCLPPQNRPQTDEIKRCNPYLRSEITALSAGSIVLALGGIAHRAVLMALELPQSWSRFGHLAMADLPGHLKLIDSYHCSRYNLNTRRLTRPMFEQVFERITGLLA